MKNLKFRDRITKGWPRNIEFQTPNFRETSSINPEARGLHASRITNNTQMPMKPKGIITSVTLLVLSLSRMKNAECRMQKQRSHPSRGRLCLLTFIFLHSGFCLGAWGQSYSVDWSTIDGGGGTSTGGVYSVSGTIGQPDAGAMSSGNFTLQGGFWGVVSAVQTPGAPYLWVTLTTTNTVVVWWALSETSWVLQATTDLVTPSSIWTPRSYATNGANCVHIESAPAGNCFYRLRKP